MKGGGSPAAPAAPPAPIESLGAADKELKKIQSGRQKALGDFESSLFGQSSSKGRKIGGPRGSTQTVGGFRTPTGFDGMTLDQKVASLDRGAASRHNSQADFLKPASAGAGSRFSTQLNDIRGANAARETQLTEFIAAEMKQLDKSRRGAGRGRTGNIHAGKRKGGADTTNAQTLDKTGKTLI